MKRREQNFLSKSLFAFFSVVIFSQSNKGLSISFPLLWIEGRFRMTRNHMSKIEHINIRCNNNNNNNKNNLWHYHNLLMATIQLISSFQRDRNIIIVIYLLSLSFFILHHSCCYSHYRLSFSSFITISM